MAVVVKYIHAFVVSGKQKNLDFILLFPYTDTNRTHHASGLPCATRWDFSFQRGACQ